MEGIVLVSGGMAMRRYPLREHVQFHLGTKGCTAPTYDIWKWSRRFSRALRLNSSAASHCDFVIYGWRRAASHSFSLVALWGLVNHDVITCIIQEDLFVKQYG
jgi:hypothetical protein